MTIAPLKIFLQAAFICLLNAITGLVYLYMQFFDSPEWIIVGAAITWQGSNGGPAFVYILFNRTMQRNVFRMLGIKKGPRVGVSSTVQKDMSRAPTSVIPISVR
uniref:Serpentine Receptor, class T n=1 Tax=Steinernema glaseri TaxID=37863 RepID=A0A1I7Z8Q2_9BILA